MRPNGEGRGWGNGEGVDTEREKMQAMPTQTAEL